VADPAVNGDLRVVAFAGSLRRGPLTGKPVALMGASPSQVGTARAQLHLRQLLGHVHARTLPPPELLVAAAHERFDRELQLTHEGARRVLAGLLERFARWIERERMADAAQRALASPASYAAKT
jgi:chromate reductase